MYFKIMKEETYRNLVILLLCVLIGLYIYDLSYTKHFSTVSNNIEKNIQLSKPNKKKIICDKNICILDNKKQKINKEDVEIKSIGNINNNSLDDIESVVKKISNV
jgi:hypothetical protein